jgi:hypothetical protein
MEVANAVRSAVTTSFRAKITAAKIALAVGDTWR